MITLIRPTLAALILCVLTACSKKSEHKDYSNVPTGHDHSAHASHAHTAPHGGTLVEIGEHAYNLELLRDATTGKLTAWILDGHAENFVRIKTQTLELVAMPGGKFTPLTLQAVANPSTGETGGDTSQFEVQADWLKTTANFSGIFTVEIKGTKFEKVEFHLGK
jgi:hypothetical protein